HLYIDAPELGAADMAGLRASLMAVEGVRTVRAVDMLPGERRRLHLDALLDAMADPVLAVDAMGVIVIANAALGAVTGLDPAALTGVGLGTLFDDAGLQEKLVANGFR